MLLKTGKILIFYHYYHHKRISPISSRSDFREILSLGANIFALLLSNILPNICSYYWLLKTMRYNSLLILPARKQACLYSNYPLIFVIPDFGRQSL